MASLSPAPCPPGNGCFPNPCQRAKCVSSPRCHRKQTPQVFDLDLFPLFLLFLAPLLSLISWALEWRKWWKWRVSPTTRRRSLTAEKRNTRDAERRRRRGLSDDGGFGWRRLKDCWGCGFGRKRLKDCWDCRFSWRRLKDCWGCGLVAGWKR